MNFLHMKYAVEVAKAGSITQAAENLYMNQPNLSKAIKLLESTLGITLFRRTARGIVPTEKGEEFLQHARTILAQVEDMEALYSKNRADKISFSVSVPRASYITYAFSAFVNGLDKSKEIDINFKETNSSEAISNVYERNYNLGIIRYAEMFEKYFLRQLEEKELAYQTVWNFEHRILMSKYNPLASKEQLTYEDLKDAIEITHGDFSVPSLPAVQLRKMAPRPASKRIIMIYERGSQFDLLNRVTSTYMWVSPMPQELLDLYGLVQRKCVDEVQKYKDVIIYPSNGKTDELGEQFLAKLFEIKNRLSRNLF